jgi:DNA-binding MarR family transcriptional regulator
MVNDLHEYNSYQDKKLDLWVLLENVNYSIRRGREKELSQFGFTLIQASVLRLLRKNTAGLSLTEIASSINREQNSVSSLISRMQKKGLVEKVRNPRKSGIIIRITRKGRQSYSETLDKTFLTAVIYALSEEEQEQLQFYLQKIKVKATDLLGLIK